ncbi:cytochrome P450 [Microbacterium profundi]|uniref:cytochrome P450 n=1 Tax=Microbacterium profundi TaxID=450380 RepID=UPI001F2F404A|nr:cytochrome P450 [Microbacterium profundi]MCE7481652.1 cytochrome P450 [Microbacterium profundi]
MSVVSNIAPSLNDDPYTREILVDPYPFFARLRGAGPTAWLEQYNVHAFGRDAEVRTILEDYRTYISGAGVGIVNIHHQPPLRQPGILEVDPPNHTSMRTAMTSVINPKNMRSLRTGFQEFADELVTRVIEKGSFDAVTDFAEIYPLRVFADAVGIPREGRAENLIPQGAANFATFGPLNEIALEHRNDAEGTYEWVLENCARERLDPAGMGAGIWAEADAGNIPPEEATLLVRAMLSAGLDTTVIALGNTLRALAAHPDQYARVHENPRLMKFAIDEAFRYDAPFQSFYRTTSVDTEIAGVPLPADTKVLLFIGSANRDEDKWGPTAAKFDIDRDSSGHLTFGMGIHQCVGQPISRLEMDVLLTTFAKRVKSIDFAGDVEPFVHTTLKGYKSMPVSIVAA